MKKFFKVFGLVFIMGIIVYAFVSNKDTKVSVNMDEGVMQVSRTSGQDIQIYKDGKWEKTFLKGINLGASKPGYFPGEFGITKDDYKRWFKQIQEMNSNVIRVYTLQMPAFYEALYEHNKNNKEPLYLIHGAWVDEETMLEELDAFSPEVINTFKNEIGKIIDVLHGNATIDKVVGRGYGEYKKDVSNYVIGYILGIEWDPYFVKETNENNDGMADYNGKWLYTENADPIEVFLADCGNYAIDYETSMYNAQKPVAFTNWLTTDVIDHPDEIEEANRIANIDESKIKSKESFKSGLFVSYHVYPYYPDFLNTDDKYASYKDESGSTNSFKAYLEDLISYFKDRPVIVSEFGVPTSRGIAHEDESRGFNQGMIEETEQGEINKQLLQEIHSTGYAGAIIFSWQDEWFKRTWNTMNTTDPEGRAYWSDKMTNEQSFGLLSFDPGKKKSVSYIDGNIKEWKKKDIVSQSDNMKLYMKSDEAYVYFRINKKDLDLNKEDIIIPIDVTPKSGSKTLKDYEVAFNEDADFVIRINGKDDAKILVNEYYDVCDYLFNDKVATNKNSDTFNVVKQKILRESMTPISNKLINEKEVDVGNLIYGNSNPESEEFNSLSDFIIDGDDIEIRIPWLMLNIGNPAKKLVLDDFYVNDIIEFLEIEDIKAGAYLLENKSCVEQVNMESFSWDKWDMPIYHERLKKSYYIIKDAFGEIS